MIEKGRTLKRITAQNSISGGLRAIKNRLRWEYYERYSSDDKMTITVNGNKMNVSLSDRGISSTLAIWGVRERSATEIIKNKLNEDCTAVDIGGNIGYYTLLMGSLVGSSGFVHSIEPYSPTFELLENNIRLNNYHDRVSLYNVAIADKDGTVELLVDDRNNLNRVSDQIDRDYKETREIESSTLDSLLKDERSIDFIRMDLEGYESHVLTQECMGKILRKSKPKILFEVHPNYSEKMREVLYNLDQLGYKFEILTSSNEAQSTAFRKEELEPLRTLKDGTRVRGFYKNIETHVAIDLICTKEQVVRDVLLV